VAEEGGPNNRDRKLFLTRSERDLIEWRGRSGEGKGNIGKHLTSLIFFVTPSLTHPNQSTMQLPTDPPSTLLSNPHAPSSLPRAIAIPIGVIGTATYVVCLPAYILLQTIKYYAIGEFSGWSEARISPSEARLLRRRLRVRRTPSEAAVWRLSVLLLASSRPPPCG
jgi:hypothetical protein